MSRGPAPKVVRIIDKYDLDGLGAELERRWTDESDRASLRELARDINIRLVSTVLSAVGESPLEGEPENLYRLLRDDGVSQADRIQARNRLERLDIDVDELLSDFVSRQAVHTYLTRHREVTPPSLGEEEDQGGRRIQSIQRLRGRLESVTRSTLTDLRKAEEIVLGDFSIVISVTVHCNDCGSQASIERLLDAGGCRCSESPEEGLA